MKAMKTLIAALIATAMLTAGAQRACAHDHGWSTAGKVLTGVAIGGAVASAFQPAPVYAAPAVVYSQPQVVYAPAPVYQPAPAPVYVAAPPVVVYAPPVYYPRPAPYYWGGPVVSFRFGYGGGHGHYHH
jgi:hypothetical protein